MSAAKPEPGAVTLQPVTADDFEALVAVRIAAMRESLERVGRFDPARARERLRQNFAPEHTQWILRDNARVGFCTFRPAPDGFHLDHLYVRPESQNHGIGGVVLRRLLVEAERQDRPVHVGALKESESNRFYQRHGFVQTGESEWDVHYVREAHSEAAVCQPSAGRRVVIIGNAGSGKTHLAQRLAARKGLPVLSLDALFWADNHYQIKRPEPEVLAAIEKHKQTDAWIVEGVFGEWADRFLDRAELLLWLDLDWVVCRRSMEARWQATPQHSLALEESFKRLIEYAGDYWRRTDGRSQAGHRRLFEAFAGVKRKFTQRAEVDAFLAER